MNNQSLWLQDTKTDLKFNQLKQDMHVDVAIVGAGITGLTTALALIEQGKKVAVLEAHEIGDCTTAYSTGNLYIPVQPYFKNIIHKFNLETAQQVATSRAYGIDYIEKIIQTHQIDCQFMRRPWYLFANNAHQCRFLEKELDTFQRLGLDVKEVKELPVPIKIKKGILLENQARMNPYQYILGLCKVLKDKGCHIFTNSAVTHVEENAHCIVYTPLAKLTANHLVIATHSPIGVHGVQLFTAPYRSYVVAVKLKSNDYPEGQFWDLEKSHHALCTHPIYGNKPELMLVAGEHHKTGQEKNSVDHYANLLRYLEEHFAVDEVAFHWSAQHFQTADDVPYIGLASNAAKKTYMATGYFADGLVYGTLAGLIMSDEITGLRNQWASTYRSTRIKPFASLPFLIKENSNVVFQYMKDLPKPSLKNSSELQPGEAKVVEINREKVAVYKDKENKVHAVSAVCTHMKGIVNWNNAEKTWDCPCHGSRFTIDGDVIDGPAMIKLAKKEL